MISSTCFCWRSLRQIKPVVPKYCATRIVFLSHVEKCSKLSSAALSQTALKKPCERNADRIEVHLIKNLLAGQKTEQPKELVTKTTKYDRGIEVIEKRPCTSVNGQCSYKNQLIWQDILPGPKILSNQGDFTRESTLIGVSHEMWYCTKIDQTCPKKHLKDGIVAFSVPILDSVQCSSNRESQVTENRTKSGPSSEELSLVLLKLREELPNFFEGQHQYSIYSKDILFVNKLTRTTTRTLKSYKYIMNLMMYAGKLFWTKASLDILRVTKHSEDNTIKVRWTAKGIPWYQLPFFLLTGKPQNLFYRYVDGFSIFEVGRDGLVHCHRLDKVMPAPRPERQKWSIRMQVLALLGLGEITHEPCEAFQVKTQEMLK